MGVSKRSGCFLKRIVLGVSWVFLAIHCAVGQSVTIESDTNRQNRIDAIIQVRLTTNDPMLKKLQADIDKLMVGSPVAWSIARTDLSGQSPSVVEVEKTAETELKLTWVERGPWPSGTRRTWKISGSQPVGFQSPWTWTVSGNGQIELHHAQRGFVFRYNREPVNQPGLPQTQLRGAYIHPFLTPSGNVATGDFSPFHTHHRGFFLAYAKTKRETLAPDFWNIHAGTAKIVPDPSKFITLAGPVTARLETQHDWQLRDKSKPDMQSGEKVLDEKWMIQVYDVPAQPAWIWDLKSTQTPLNKDLELSKHRYGGMAYRGPEPFVKGKLDVLTSEGKTDRTIADQKPARWFDLTGPSKDGSSHYLGAVMCDHPDNVRHPNVVRIHPVSLPFFSFVPAHAESLNLKAGVPYVWKYRTMVHDGRPDWSRDQALFNDFADPVTIHMVP